jgi:hypothetical protein
MIIGAIICTKELRNSTNMLIFNLALADFLVTAFVDLFTILGLLLLFLSLFIGFLVDLPNILGWGGHSFDIHTLSCL